MKILSQFLYVFTKKIVAITYMFSAYFIGVFFEMLGVGLIIQFINFDK